MSNLFQTLLENNNQWALEHVAKDTKYFTKLAQRQTPSFLYIGCSDSRVSPEQMMDTPLGEMLVYRNIAGQISKNDKHCLAILEFALRALKIRDIIICGHYECGGVKASLTKEDLDPSWKHIQECIHPLLSLRTEFADELKHFTTPEEKCDFLVEKNIEKQYKNLLEIDIVQENLSSLNITTCLFNIRLGRIRELEF